MKIGVSFARAFGTTLALGLLTACPGAVPIVGPTASCVTTVIADALKGLTIAQILADAGPSCVASAEEVITILLGSTDPQVKASGAYHEALTQRDHP